ncbi:bifunctional DNA primase/polymerase [Streptomyces sp. NPDC002574]|uniref:bifunctional DNA primase/polymerase n=1 Tax=Streptomyces sp. NPDC002574 TaxID=3364652 RepID=UPI0036B694FF
MREILGKRRKSSPELLRAALTCAEQWQWPVVPGAGTDGHGGCACLRPDCPVPGAHPHDPGLLAATRDPRMVRWWWTHHPDQPVVLATGGCVSAVSLPAVAGARALGVLAKRGVRVGPVVATPTRVAVLVEPYSLEELGELLDRHEWVPSSLRFHGQGGYTVLPPSPVGAGGARWERRPVVDPGERAPWLPSVRVIVDTLVQAGRTAPDGSRLSY